jgi:2-polyprenyl-3-methyl-5-hydroxy-6-metoxy-1,4-benzoquinol methylase
LFEAIIKISKVIKTIFSKIKRIFTTKEAPYNFNKSNPLGGNGERVDIQLSKTLNYDKLDVYQKNHFKRYEFAKQFIKENEICGDFACGTGYGSVLIASKAKEVIGADINAEVVQKISLRYKGIDNVSFIHKNILELDYENKFDTILSFETLEHFEEENIIKLLAIYNRALKNKGRIIFSTPYMQENSEEAIKMGFHFTFYINEDKIKSWCEKTAFNIETFNFQNYDTHHIEEELNNKEFIICIASK